MNQELTVKPRRTTIGKVGLVLSLVPWATFVCLKIVGPASGSG